MPRFMPRFRAADAYEEVWETCEHGPQAFEQGEPAGAEWVLARFPARRVSAWARRTIWRGARAISDEAGRRGKGPYSGGFLVIRAGAPLRSTPQSV